MKLTSVLSDICAAVALLLYTHFQIIWLLIAAARGSSKGLLIPQDTSTLPSMVFHKAVVAFLRKVITCQVLSCGSVKKIDASRQY